MDATLLHMQGRWLPTDGGAFVVSWLKWRGIVLASLRSSRGLESSKEQEALGYLVSHYHPLSLAALGTNALLYTMGFTLTI